MAPGFRWLPGPVMQQAVALGPDFGCPGSSTSTSSLLATACHCWNGTGRQLRRKMKKHSPTLRRYSDSCPSPCI